MSIAMSRALGDAEIDRVDQRERDGRDDLEQRVPFAGLALTARRPHPARHGDGDLDIVRAGAAHTERAPVVEHA